MRRMAVGMVAGLAAWFGSAVVAEAQWIQPTGPTAVYIGDTGTTFTATVTLTALVDFGVQLKVYKGNNLTTPIWSCEEWTYSPTQLVNYFTKNPTWSPPAIYNSKYTFKVKLLVGTQIIEPDPWIKTATEYPPHSYLQPSKSSDLALEAIDRDRRHEA